MVLLAAHVPGSTTAMRTNAQHARVPAEVLVVLEVLATAQA